METKKIQEGIVRVLGPVGSVLDVGCGDCSLVRFLAKTIAQEAIGIDLERDFPEKMRFNIGGEGHTAECIEGDARAIDFPDGRFDAVVSMRAFHEVEDPAGALFEMRRVLRPGGMLLVADFTEGEPDESEGYYAPEAIESLLKENGFEQVEVIQIPRDTFMFAAGKKPPL